MMNTKVNFYFNKSHNWKTEIQQLRTIVLDCGLNEELKWGCPCYTLNRHNIVLIHVFKSYCALLFFKGALLKDNDNILTQQTENVQSARQMRFASSSEIADKVFIIKAYIFEAIEVEKAGLKVQLKNTSEFIYPEEFKKKLNEMPALKIAFDKLTAGRQKAYLLHFSAPKQSKTREARIEKNIPQILNGKGLNE